MKCPVCNGKGRIIDKIDISVRKGEIYADAIYFPCSFCKGIGQLSIIKYILYWLKDI